MKAKPTLFFSPFVAVTEPDAGELDEKPMLSTTLLSRVRFNVIFRICLCSSKIPM